MTRGEFITSVCQMLWNVEFEDQIYFGCNNINCPDYTACENCKFENFWDRKVTDEDLYFYHHKMQAVREREKIADLVSEYCEKHAIYDWGIIDLIRKGGRQ